ncbi:glycosyltransferase family 2 protein [Rothia terrae]|uniref:Glycosyltransferase n=1 Tax=Rothia terrae TaxID=396015 RepID=A0A7H2BE52_9MICC|nr:glycosyltransferase [Rothia terrae]QNV37948.1 glycosyltransferase [Rothia terrae]
MVSLVTLADATRHQRIQNQHVALTQSAPDISHGLVVLKHEEFSVDGVQTIAHLSDDKPLLAHARNTAGDWAAQNSDDEIIIFLDADCLPGKHLIERYVQALDEHPHAVVTGPVTYLEAQDSTEQQVAKYCASPATLDAVTSPHPARPYPEEGTMFATTPDQYNVFWSLTFALRASTWKKIRAEWGGFDEDFKGYGGEDTDFGWKLREHDVELWWVGGAHAYHVWHPVSSPPWENLTDIVANANTFYEKWGQWAMLDWLKEFEAAGAVRRVKDRWELV